MFLPESRFMERAIELARGAAGFTNPNPLVGAVVVKDGAIIGEGCHERYGEFHAERNALASCTASAVGATIYVTLEPCCHSGKQPPCTDALIEAGTARVVVGSRDPNPLVAGRGNELLRAAGIEVIEDFMRESCDEINPIFFHYIEKRDPLVVAKWAMSADGHIACASRDSKWVSGERSREDVQRLRHRLAGIMVGIGTVLADDPLLTCRIEGALQPMRIVCDSQLRIPLDCRLVETARQYGLIVACASDDGTRIAELEERGVKVLHVADESGSKVDLRRLMHILGDEYRIDSILLEGGATLNAAAFEAGIVDAVITYIAPKIVGGKDAPSPVAGAGATKMADALILGEPVSVERFDNDIRIIYSVEKAGE